MKYKPGERSFSLIETVIALSIVTFLIIEVSAVQGNAILFSDYGRNITQAIWLAKRVMANVEYRASYSDFKDLEVSEPVQAFEDFPEYSYSLEIREWKLSLTQILQMAISGNLGGAEASDDSDDPNAGELRFIEQGVKQVFGDEPIFMTARVEVSWAEGAARNNTSLTHLFTNQKKLDDYIATLKPVWDQVTKPKSTSTATKTSTETSTATSVSPNPVEG